MATSQPTPGTPLNPAVDERRWVDQIRRFLDEDNEEDSSVDPVSISNVPKQLIATKPEAYIPQEVALGPYHCWRPELYEMERYKISAAKRTQKRLETSDFQTLIDQFVKLEPKIRSCYHRYLDYSGETLAWMLAVDASFLLEFLSIFTAQDRKDLERISPRMLHLVDYAGTKSAHNEILRDIMMLENQIPLFLLRKTLESESSSDEEADEQLTRILMGLCGELSPFKTIDSFVKIKALERAHLLELLYYVVVQASEQQSVAAEESNDQDVVIEVTVEEFVDHEGYVWTLIKTVWRHFSSLAVQRSNLLSETARVLRVILKLPLKILSRIPGLSLLIQPVYDMFSSEAVKDEKQEDGNSNSKPSPPPSVEEIAIPSVTELAKIGVKFSPTRGDLSTICFDEKTCTFYLPAVTLDINTEVILRNLVAFEASIVSGPLVFTRYTELMNGIIDSEEDVKTLREMGILSNFLKSDGEAASLWNGMSKSVKLTKVPSLDKVIEDVNRCHSRRWKAKIKRFLKKYVFGWWKCLTFLAAILLLLMTAMEAFCSVYTCARWFHVVVQEE